MAHKLACADFTFPLLTHDQALKLIAMLGFDGVDIGLFEERSHLWPSWEFKDASQSARRLKGQLDDLGLKAADIFLQMDNDFTPYAVNHPDAVRRQKARDWFKKTLDYAATCGCHHITTLPGVHFAEEEYEVSFERAIKELQWRKVLKPPPLRPRYLDNLQTVEKLKSLQNGLSVLNLIERRNK